MALYRWRWDIYHMFIWCQAVPHLARTKRDGWHLQGPPVTPGCWPYKGPGTSDPDRDAAQMTSGRTNYWGVELLTDRKWLVCSCLKYYMYSLTIVGKAYSNADNIQYWLVLNVYVKPLSLLFCCTYVILPSWQKVAYNTHMHQQCAESRVFCSARFRKNP